MPRLAATHPFCGGILLYTLLQLPLPLNIVEETTEWCGRQLANAVRPAHSPIQLIRNDGSATQRDADRHGFLPALMGWPPGRD